LGKQMWMTCHKHRDSYQEVNSVPGVQNEVFATASPDYSKVFAFTGAEQQRQQRQTALPGYRATLFVRFEACQTHHPLRLNDFTEASWI
jgi:hypothetical protein